MGKKMIHMIDYLFNSKRENRARYTLNKVTKTTYKNIGIVE